MPRDRDSGLNWRYLRTAALTGVGAGAVGAGLAAAAERIGVASLGAGMLGVTVLGGALLLAFFGATTSEPSAAADASVEPIHAASDLHERVDRGFGVSHALLWAGIGLVVAGLAGLVYAW
ncbi:hypothetical protein [Halobaculum sp. D14]|uniref:hypothetical protein n=1 Tax=unclassified Halobaculum TaxID=2640896 RepID=UPI003EB9BC12